MASPAEALNRARVLPYAPRRTDVSRPPDTLSPAVADSQTPWPGVDGPDGTLEIAPIRRFEEAATESLAAGASPSVLTRALAQRIAEARSRSVAQETRAQTEDAARKALIEACELVERAEASLTRPHSALAQYARAGAVLQRARLLGLGTGGTHDWLRLFHSCLVFTPFEELGPDSLRLLASLLRGASSAPADIGVVRQSLVRSGFRLLPAGALRHMSADARR